MTLMVGGGSARSQMSFPPLVRSRVPVTKSQRANHLFRDIPGSEKWFSPLLYE
jgi:hypothetical protein